jgi:hypothetical protein
LILEDAVPTSFLTTSSSASAIANALNSAAASITNPECRSFGVTVSLSANHQTMKIKVEFYVDSNAPITLISAFTGSLEGK